MTMQRLYWTTLEKLLPKLARQVYVDDQKPIDLTIEQLTMTDSQFAVGRRQRHLELQLAFMG